MIDSSSSGLVAGVSLRESPAPPPLYPQLGPLPSCEDRTVFLL